MTIKQNPYMKNEVILDIEDCITLLEYKMEILQRAKEENSSWNYGIDELKEQINQLKRLQ